MAGLGALRPTQLLQLEQLLEQGGEAIVSGFLDLAIIIRQVDRRALVFNESKEAHGILQFLQCSQWFSSRFDQFGALHE